MHDQRADDTRLDTPDEQSDWLDTDDTVQRDQLNATDEPLRANGSESTEEPQPLFRPDDADRFRTQWEQIQIRFVDDPRAAVQGADHLLDEVLQSLTTAVNDHKHELEDQGSGETEDLRLALRRYRVFLHQLLDA